MESVLDTTSAGDCKGAPAASQSSLEWRPPTPDLSGLERRLGRMEENVKTLVDLLHNQRVFNYNLYSRNFVTLF